MGYFVKAQIAQNMSIEVSGDDVATGKVSMGQCQVNNFSNRF